MGLFSLEHGKAAFVADFALYAGAVLLLTLYLVFDSARSQGPVLAATVLAGLLAWSLIEYLLHRFVLHGLQPFVRWHAAHHARPTALIGSPTVVSASGFALLVFLPAWGLFGSLPLASALTLGFVAGYLAYAVIHHATHHWRASGAWMLQRKRWHALHHRPGGTPGCYGVSSPAWDRVFGSTRSGTALTPC
jgi:cyclopropane-fatty-acyl-phospholipid synthase